MREMPPIAVVVAADHAATRSSLWSVLASEPGVAPVATASDLRDLVRLLRSSSPDVVLVDRAVLGPAGLRRVATLGALAPAAVFLVVGMGDHPGYGERAREAGAAGYVRLDHAAEQLAAAVRAAASARHG